MRVLSFLAGLAAGLVVVIMLLLLASWMPWFVAALIGGVVWLFFTMISHRANETRAQRAVSQDQADAAKDAQLTSMKYRDLWPFLHELLPDEKLKRATRFSRVQLIVPGIMTAFGVIFILIAVAIGNVQPSTWNLPKPVDDFAQDWTDAVSPDEQQATKPNKEKQKNKKAAKQKKQKQKKAAKAKKNKSATAQPKEGPPDSYPLWILPAFLGFLLVGGGWYGWIIWRSTVLLITNNYITVLCKPPPLLTFVRQRVDRTALSLIFDADAVDTFLTRFIGQGYWGSIHIWLEHQGEVNSKDRDPDIKLHPLPRYQELNAELNAWGREAGGFGAGRQSFVEHMHSEVGG